VTAAKEEAASAADHAGASEEDSEPLTTNL